MFVSIYYKPSLFNAHTMILIVHIFMNVNKLCLNLKNFHFVLFLLLFDLGTIKELLVSMGSLTKY